MKTLRTIKTMEILISYTCPYCEEMTMYETSSLPKSNVCHRCLKELEFEDEYIKNHE